MPLVIVLFALFASLFTLQKATLAFAEPFFLVAARMIFAGIILLGFLFFFKKQDFKLKLKHFKPFFMLALCNIYLTNVLEIWSIKHMVSSKACLIYSLSPFLAALVAFIVLKEKLSKQKWLGMIIGFVGLFPILFTQTQSELATGGIGFLSMAELSIVGAVFCSVYGWILLKKLISEFGYSPLMANGFSMLLGGILALAHSYFSGESFSPVPVNNMQGFITNSIIMCLISNIVCYNLYGHLLKKFTATFMSFAGLVTPLFASSFGFIFLGESVTWHFFASMILFSIGLFIFYQAEIKVGDGFKVDDKTGRSAIV